MGANTYTLHLEGTFDLPCFSRDLTMAVEYGYEPGSGPLYARGEPLPIAPADPPEVDVRRIMVARQRVEAHRTSTGRLQRTEAVLDGEWQDVTDLMRAVLDADDWQELRSEIIDQHAEYAREGAAA